MGDVRSAIESQDRTVSPKLKVGELVDEVGDLLDRKIKDLASEGPTAEAKNRTSVNRLETAKFHLVRAQRELESY